MKFLALIVFLMSFSAIAKVDCTKLADLSCDHKCQETKAAECGVDLSGRLQNEKLQNSKSALPKNGSSKDSKKVREI